MRRATAIAAALLAASPALAQEGYITTYGHEIEEGEVELMLMADFTVPSRVRHRDDGQRPYLSQMPKFGINPTDWLELEMMLEGYEETGTGESRFTGSRLEARICPFGEEVPLHPGIYFEYEDLDALTRFKMETSGWVEPPYEEDEDEPSRERILESRVILSQPFGRWNVAFNWINETDLQGDVTAFGYSAGVLYSFRGEGEHAEHAGHEHGMEEAEHHEHPAGFHLMSVGVEVFGALGDTKDFDLRPSRQEHYLQPSVTWMVGDRWMITVGAAIGLTEDSDDMIRTMVGAMWRF